MQTYFSTFDKFSSFFVTPKANPGSEKPIRELLQKAREIIDDEMISIDFISNEDFFSRIVDPVTGCINDENDTSELFSRALKLLKLDSRSKTLENTISKNNKTERKVINNLTGKRTVDGMKIGQYVQYQMRKIFEEKLLTDKDIQNLQNKIYSKETFNQNFEILRSTNNEIVDSDGRNRYYTKEKFFGEYFLTSQWVEYHWESFLSWLRKIKK